MYFYVVFINVPPITPGFLFSQLVIGIQAQGIRRDNKQPCSHWWLAWFPREPGTYPVENSLQLVHGLKGSDLQNAQLADEEVNDSPRASQHVAVQTGAPEQQVEFLKEGIKSSRVLVVQGDFQCPSTFLFLWSPFIHVRIPLPLCTYKGLCDFKN